MNGHRENALRLEEVRIRLASRDLLSLSAKVRPGEVLTVMGPSGSGKSSLLAYIGGFLDPAFEASGNVYLAGELVTERPAEKRRVGILFQDALLFPHMSVGGNLYFALSSDIRGRVARRKAVEVALLEAGLQGMADRDPATLSGGQASRVAMMRVLLAKPGALLLDEPFSKLDADLRNQIRRFVFEEAKRHQLPVLMVTHDEADARAAVGEVIVLGE